MKLTVEFTKNGGFIVTLNKDKFCFNSIQELVSFIEDLKSKAA